MGTTILTGLESARSQAGAYYREDDPLRSPTVAYLTQRLASYTDPDEQLRLAFYYEERAATDPAAFGQAMDLYRTVRDQRVALVRLKIGNEYLLGENDFPKDAAIAGRWYGFAAKAGSAEACRRLREMQPQESISTSSVEAGACSAR